MHSLYRYIVSYFSPYIALMVLNKDDDDDNQLSRSLCTDLPSPPSRPYARRSRVLYLQTETGIVHVIPSLIGFKSL